MTANQTGSRERVLAALQFRPPDRVPLEYHASPAGFNEHGARLAGLWSHYPDDFGPPGRFPLCAPPPESIDAEGRYCEYRTDEWGVTRRFLVYGVAGIPIEQPLADWSRLEGWRPPGIPLRSGDAFEAARARAARYREAYYLKSGWISLFELMHSLRSFEDVLTDIATGRPEIHLLADQLTEYHAGYIRYLLERGVDAIQFGDDFGTQSGLMLSPKLWREFFKPRYRQLAELAHGGGARVFFHSCGCVRGLLDEFADLGVDAIWPQLNVYNAPDLARRCRETRVAIALHPDRGEIMLRSTPAQVTEYVMRLAEQFEVDRGGAWFYVEIDAGFPFANVAALTETIAHLRGC